MDEYDIHLIEQAIEQVVEMPGIRHWNGSQRDLNSTFVYIR